MSTWIDFTPRHRRLNAAQARDALKDLVDFSKFDLRFHDASGPNAAFLNPKTAAGKITAAGSIPLEQLEGGGHFAIRVGRLPSGKTPIRLDMRLLKNTDSLRRVVKHEIAEANEILRFEGRYMDLGTLHQLLESADSAGYEGE